MGGEVKFYTENKKDMGFCKYFEKLYLIMV